MISQEEIIRQGDVLARKVGFSSIYDAPPVVNAMLLESHSQSPLFKPGMVNFVNGFRTEFYGKPVDFEFTPKAVHDFFCDMAKGIHFVTKKYPDVKKLKRYDVAPAMEVAPEDIRSDFHAAFFAHSSGQGLIISPMLMIPVMADKVLRDIGQKPKNQRDFEHKKRLYAVTNA